MSFRFRAKTKSTDKDAKKPPQNVWLIKEGNLSTQQILGPSTRPCGFLVLNGSYAAIRGVLKVSRVRPLARYNLLEFRLGEKKNCNNQVSWLNSAVRVHLRLLDVPIVRKIIWFESRQYSTIDRQQYAEGGRRGGPIAYEKYEPELDSTSRRILFLVYFLAADTLVTFS